MRSIPNCQSSYVCGRLTYECLIVCGLKQSSRKNILPKVASTLVGGSNLHGEVLGLLIAKVAPILCVVDEWIDMHLLRLLLHTTRLIYYFCLPKMLENGANLRKLAVQLLSSEHFRDNFTLQRVMSSIQRMVCTRRHAH